MTQIAASRMSKKLENIKLRKKTKKKKDSGICITKTLKTPKTHHKYSKLFCNCGFIANSESSFLGHYCDNHLGKIFLCDVCKVEFSTMEKLASHMNNEHFKHLEKSLTQTENSQKDTYNEETFIDNSSMKDNCSVVGDLQNMETPQAELVSTYVETEWADSPQAETATEQVQYHNGGSKEINLTEVSSFQTDLKTSLNQVDSYIEVSKEKYDCLMSNNAQKLSVNSHLKSSDSYKYPSQWNSYSRRNISHPYGPVHQHDVQNRYLPQQTPSFCSQGAVHNQNAFGQDILHYNRFNCDKFFKPHASRYSQSTQNYPNGKFYHQNLNNSELSACVIHGMKPDKFNGCLSYDNSNISQSNSFISDGYSSTLTRCENPSLKAPHYQNTPIELCRENLNPIANNYSLFARKHQNKSYVEHGKVLDTNLNLHNHAFAQRSRKQLFTESEKVQDSSLLYNYLQESNESACKCYEPIHPTAMHQNVLNTQYNELERQKSLDLHLKSINQPIYNDNTVQLCTDNTNIHRIENTISNSSNLFQQFDSNCENSDQIIANKSLDFQLSSKNHLPMKSNAVQLWTQNDTTQMESIRILQPPTLFQWTDIVCEKSSDMTNSNEPEQEKDSNLRLKLKNQPSSTGDLDWKIVDEVNDVEFSIEKVRHGKNLGQYAQLKDIKVEKEDESCNLNNDGFCRVEDVYTLSPVSTPTERNIEMSEPSLEGDNFRFRIEKLQHFFKCMVESCFYSSSETLAFALHLISHDLDVIRCPFCPCKLKPDSSLINHMTHQHGRSIYQCNYCFYRAQSMTHLVVHTKIMHPLYKMEVVTCKNPAMNKEVPVIHSVRIYLCVSPECKFKTAEPDTLIKHIKCDHQLIKIGNFSKKDLLFKNSKTNLKSSFINRCLYCNFQTFHKSYLLVHLCKQHPDNPLRFSSMINSGSTIDDYIKQCPDEGILYANLINDISLAKKLPHFNDKENYLTQDYFFETPKYSSQSKKSKNTVTKKSIDNLHVNLESDKSQYESLFDYTMRSISDSNSCNINSSNDCNSARFVFMDEIEIEKSCENEKLDVDNAETRNAESEIFDRNLEISNKSVITQAKKPKIVLSEQCVDEQVSSNNADNFSVEEIYSEKIQSSDTHEKDAVDDCENEIIIPNTCEQIITKYQEDSLIGEVEPSGKEQVGESHKKKLKDNSSETLEEKHVHYNGKRQISCESKTLKEQLSLKSYKSASLLCGSVMTQEEANSQNNQVESMMCVDLNDLPSDTEKELNSVTCKSDIWNTDKLVYYDEIEIEDTFECEVFTM